MPRDFALGGLIGLAVAIFRAVLDNKVRSPGHIEQLTDRPAI